MVDSYSAQGNRWSIIKRTVYGLFLVNSDIVVSDFGAVSGKRCDAPMRMPIDFKR